MHSNLFIEGTYTILYPVYTQSYVINKINN